MKRQPININQRMKQPRRIRNVDRYPELTIDEVRQLKKNIKNRALERDKQWIIGYFGFLAVVIILNWIIS